MEKKRSSSFTRLFAVLALAGAVVIVVIAIASSLEDSDSSDKSGNGNGGQSQKVRPKTTAKTYVVKGGDTLVSIAHRTGVPVGHILALNPDVDPQILIAGQTLQLR